MLQAKALFLPPGITTIICEQTPGLHADFASYPNCLSGQEARSEPVTLWQSGAVKVKVKGDCDPISEEPNRK